MITVIAATLLNLAPMGAGDGSVWDRLAACESGGDWSANTGNGFSGGLQFSDSTWQAMGGSTQSAWAASREEQIAVAQRLYDEVGWSAWPGCAAQLGLSGDPGGGGGGEVEEPDEDVPAVPEESESEDDDSADDGVASLPPTL
jgi:resuscitation-promoting factor RpfA